MSTVYTINSSRVFSIEQAQEVLPIVRKITRSYSEQVKVLVDRIEDQSSGSKNLNWEMENKVNTLIETWKSKVQKLGVIPRGLWIGDFPAADGYYCWKYPETEIKFWHGKDDGYSKRKNICTVEFPTENSL